MDEISLREIIEIILKRKKIIVGAMVICMIGALLWTFYSNRYGGEAKVVLEMKFQGIEKGLNPDGTKFDVSLIKSPAIIQNAIESLNIDKSTVNIDQIRRSIDIEPIIPKATVDKAAKMAKDGKDFMYYPNQFMITYRLSNSSQVGKTTGRDILDSTISSYEKFFYDTYSDKAILANAVGPLKYDEYDYPEVSNVIHRQIDIIKNYLDIKSKEALDFRSTKTGMAFNDLSEQVGIIDTVDLKRMDSIIGAYNLTKDKDKLITKYEYAIKMNDLEKSKKESESKVALDMMNNFKQEKNSILIPGLSNLGEANADEKDNLTKIDNNSSYYDELAKRSTDAGVEANNRIYDNEFLKSEINRLKNDTVSAEAKEAASKNVISLMDSIKSKLGNWIQTINETALDYYNYKFNQSITRLSPVEVYAAADAKLNIAIGIALGLLLGILAAFFKEYWISTSAKKEMVKNESISCS